MSTKKSEIRENGKEKFDTAARLPRKLGFRESIHSTA